MALEPAPAGDGVETPDDPPTPPTGRVDAFMGVSLAVGLLLMAGSKLMGGLTSAESQLILVMGLGVVLGALGSAAMVDYKPFIVTGGAAIGLVLGFFLQNTTGGDFAEIRVKNFPRDATVTMSEEDQFFAAQTVGAHKFIVMRPHLKAKSFQAEIDRGEGVAPVRFDCIPAEKVTSAMGSGDPVDWEYRHLDGEQPMLLDENSEPVAEVGPCRRAHTGHAQPTRGLFAGLSVLGMAWAAEDTDELVEALRSNSSFVRRTARKELAALGATAVPALISTFDLGLGNYRLQIGALVALNDMVSRDPALRATIAGQMSDGQLGYVARLAADADATIRSYALRLLQVLDDPRVPHTVAAALEEADPSAEADLLLLLRDKATDADQSARSAQPALRRAVTAVRSKPASQRTQPTAALVKQIDAAANGAPKDMVDKVFVQIGAFADTDKARAFAAGMNAKDPPAPVSITAPRKGDGLTRVMVGTYQDRTAAQSMVKTLIEADLVSDAYLSGYPDEIAETPFK